MYSWWPCTKYLFGNFGSIFKVTVGLYPSYNVKRPLVHSQKICMDWPRNPEWGYKVANKIHVPCSACYLYSSKSKPVAEKCAYRNDHCCVRQCNNDARYQPHLSFHRFPKYKNRKRDGIIKIKRDESKKNKDPRDDFEVTDVYIYIYSRYLP